MTAMNQVRIGTIRRTGNRATTGDEEQAQRDEQRDEQGTELAESVGLARQAVDLDIDLPFGVRVEFALFVRIVVMPVRVVAVLVSHRLLAGTEIPVRMCAAQPHRQHDEAEQDNEDGSDSAQASKHHCDGSKRLTVDCLNGTRRVFRPAARHSA